MAISDNCASVVTDGVNNCGENAIVKVAEVVAAPPQFTGVYLSLTNLYSMKLSLIEVSLVEYEVGSTVFDKMLEEAV